MSLLDLPTATLMSAGGDDRITLDEQSGLNSYGCAPEPVRAISYSSSTASSISAPAYAHAHAVHHQLRLAVANGESEDAAYTRFLRNARGRIRRVYSLAADVDVAFGASGTDLEYLALAIALQSGQRVTNVVVEVDEVGSGCLFSQAGQYFAARTALGLDVVKGAHLPGFDADLISVETLKTRTDDGPVRQDDEYAQMLLKAASEIIAKGKRPLVHIIHRSKTGIVTPSLSAIDKLISVHGDAVDLVVDACQGRISPDTIQAYLARGASIFMTGSKFIGGPPFSAWALIPARLSARMKSGSIAPAGLAHFFARGDMPTGWIDTDHLLPMRTNFGLLLRLEAGLFELERLLTMPMDRVDAVILAFGKAMRTLADTMPFRLIEGAANDPAAGDHQNGSSPIHPLDRKMLYVIELTDPLATTGQSLSVEQAREVYRGLYTDMTDRFSLPRECLIASEICHLGQPVKCLKDNIGEWAPTLRLSLSAPQVFEMIGLDADRLVERFTADIERIAAKIRLVIATLG
ncbi:hypothetical protein EUU23_12740 [Sphingorhabdus sp. IMCC26285]|uniref:Aminotransferase class V-fold PLP-dependent enzyme n=1 Tax=Sphingorhabdus profundilacus TaxID=2509718 RepID=A0A6I4LYM8_9SPHN|nr:hypothetical protein [Sphingorhabdus profundilacus]MVZ98562.1 hypothetical protein [Sphingorhabdus profundilacus]